MSQVGGLFTSTAGHALHSLQVHAYQCMCVQCSWWPEEGVGFSGNGVAVMHCLVSFGN